MSPSVPFDRCKEGMEPDRPRVQKISHERPEREWICGVYAGTWDASGVPVKLCISPLSRGDDAQKRRKGAGVDCGGWGRVLAVRGTLWAGTRAGDLDGKT